MLARGEFMSRWRARCSRLVKRFTMIFLVLKYYFSAFRIYFLDGLAFVRYSSASSYLFGGYSHGFIRAQAGLRALIMADCHKLEKGLSLSNRRGYFGLGVAERLIRNLEEYKFDSKDTLGLQDVFSCLREYREFLTEKPGGPASASEVVKKIDRLLSARLSQEKVGGTFVVESALSHAQSKLDLTNFFMSRHSVREFAPGAVDLKLLVQAVRLAQRAPSVCNRQSWRVYSYRNADDARKVLSFQGGNQGFRDSISNVLVVTSDLSTFISPEERNQSWVDGGLFSMSLVYALHSLGIGTCCLNWCVTPEQDAKFKAFSKIPETQRIIMFIAFGHLKERFSVACSERYPVDQVLFDQSL